MTELVQSPLSHKMRQVKHIHFIGIGGVGMSGIAEVLHNQGYTVSGSDKAQSTATDRLTAQGIHCYYGHDASHVKGADVVVFSSAVLPDNVEWIAAQQARITMVPRAQMLAELMRFRFGIAIAGTHGKTTTTSLIASIFAQAKLDPTYVIGGKLNSVGMNAKLGLGHYLIAEADESDASFLLLNPMVAVVTNIDEDHMSTYENDPGKLKQAFLNFIHKVPFYGTVIVCIDDPVIKALLPEINRPVVTYGFDEGADICAKHFKAHGLSSSFECVVKGRSYALHLNIPGRHNVLNALASIAAGLEEGIDMSVIAQVFKEFAGIGRRFQATEIVLNGKNMTLVDDYGHHPKELSVIQQTIRESWPDRRLVTVFQPHRFTRTHDLFDDFVNVLSKTDELVLLEVYSAGETPIAGATSRELVRAIRQRATVEPVLLTEPNDLVDVLSRVTQDGDMVLMQGAGSIGGLYQSLASEYAHEGHTTAESKQS